MSSELIARAYQEEIFRRAQQENVIATLDTGSGKTYIAVLLIRWLATRCFPYRKIYIFIVPRVPLVEQQKEFLADQLPLTVRGYYGAIVDPWEHDPVRWTQEFEECDVMVMTAQVLVDALVHAHWAISQVALLVFDEAHHARGRHPYNQIMCDFFKPCSPISRPKIFGMTASPVWNLKNPQKSLKVLEDNLYAKIIGVKENITELRVHSPRPTELIVEYPSDVCIPQTYPSSLWDRLLQWDLDSFPAIVRDSVEQRYNTTKKEVGSYAADYYLHLYLKTVLSKLEQENPYTFIQMETQGRLMDMPIIDSDAMSIDSTNTDMSTRVTNMKDVLAQFSESISFDEKEIIMSEWLSPKLRRLVQLLEERRSESPDSFQGIVFVEQRQVAATLAWILPRIPELKGWISSGALVGHGSGRISKSQGMADTKQRELLKSFRNGSCNLLISTSVGEEGLDFQACDLIIRYDQLQNMVGYLQSRGRARKFNSTYVVMVPKNDDSVRLRYETFRESEASIKDIYQGLRDIATSTIDAHSLDDMDISDITHRYEIPSTGAVLTLGSAVSLLNHLCALIPRDKYTKVLQPEYTGDFVSTVTLPSALPIPRDKLAYTGALRRTKREAKAAAAFNACKVLHQLGVFDDYLLPLRKTGGEIIEDADGQPVPEVKLVNEIMDVLVFDPWCPWIEAGDDLSSFSRAWVYAIISQDGPPSMALVLMSKLGSLSPIFLGDRQIRFGSPCTVLISREEIKLLHDYSTLGIRWCNTSKQIKSSLTCCIALLKDGGLDFAQMKEISERPTRPTVDSITFHDEDRIVIQSKYEIGRPLLLRQLRDDLTPLSYPLLLDGAESEGVFETYLAFFEHKYSTKGYPARIPETGPLLLVEKFDRNFSSRYALFPTASIPATQKSDRKTRLVPASICDTLVLPEHIMQTFLVLPQMIRRITDVYRAQVAMQKLGLSNLIEDRVVEALTLPCATARYNNQRLETLGDSVLKLCVVVYIFNKFPYRHEGQLDNLRKNSVSNRTLLARAKAVRLEQFITSEPSDVRKWRPTEHDGKFVDGTWYATRQFPRRSLQDCMEALLGASFISGGIAAALKTGTVLRLCVGGAQPWHIRYSNLETSPVPALFGNLQEQLGYQFNNGRLLVEAISHPSFVSDNACYQRLEFLGDALIDLVVLEYLFHKFPQATSGQLSWAKSRAVWAPALTTIAVQELSLHKLILVSNASLQKAMTKAVQDHSQMTYEYIVYEGWRCEPPKVLSDVVESLCGAMLVDSGYDYERVKKVILRLMEPVLQVLHPHLPKDPTSELLLSIAKRSCQRAKFQKFSSEKSAGHNNMIRFLIHDQQVGDAIEVQSGYSLSRAKPLLAQKVRELLNEEAIEALIREVCDCAATKKEKEHLIESTLSEMDRKELDDEKEDEFAVLGLLELKDTVEKEGMMYKNDESDEELVTEIIDRMDM